MVLLRIIVGTALQVLQDQRLLQDRILHLTGKPGVKRLEEALRDARTKHAEAIAEGAPIYSPFITLTGPGSPPSYSNDSTAPLPPEGVNQDIDDEDKPKVVEPQFTFPPPIRRVPVSLMVQETQEPSPNHPSADLTNENIVNEMLHDAKWQLKNGGASLTGPEISLATKRMIDIQVHITFSSDSSKCPTYRGIT